MIETERLILRQWKIEDVEDAIEGLNNINVSKWLAQVPYPYTRKDAELFIESSINSRAYNFAIVLKSENKVIGGTQLSNIDYQNGTATGGLWINEKYHGKGYGTEAFGARIKYAFDVLGVFRLGKSYNNVHLHTPHADDLLHPN